MKKLLIILILTVVSSSAMAEWAKVAITNEAIFYTDSDNSIKSGNKIKMWMMVDLTAAREVGDDKYLSSHARIEYDCKQKKYRPLQAIFYDENMGRGTVIYKENDTEKLGFLSNVVRV